MLRKTLILCTVTLAIIGLFVVIHTAMINTGLWQPGMTKKLVEHHLYEEYQESHQNIDNSATLYDVITELHIIEALGDEIALKGMPINTTVRGSVVHLDGTVTREYHRVLAEEIAAQGPGITTVNNALSVLSSNNEQYNFHSIHDISITATVNTSLLRNPILRRVKAQFGTRIRVRTVAGIVYLEGIVESQEQRELAGRIAEETRQVEYVVNKLKVL